MYINVKSTKYHQLYQNQQNTTFSDMNGLLCVLPQDITYECMFWNTYLCIYIHIYTYIHAYVCIYM